MNNSVLSKLHGIKRSGFVFSKFYPDYRFRTIQDIPGDFFKSKGIKFAVLDIDNTLVPYTMALPDEKALAFLKRLEAEGIGYAFVSNNDIERVSAFCDGIEALYIAKSGKPFIRNIKRAMRHLGGAKNNTVLIGDQVFTDVYAANRAGILSVMVDPIEAKETPFFGFKRAMEKIVLKNYYKKCGNGMK